MTTNVEFDKPPPAEPWQFSLKALLGLTTIVSICLAIGVHFAGFMVVVIVIGVLPAAMLLFGDWLIRPQHRQALAFVTAGSWAIVGSGFLVLAWRAMLRVRMPSAVSTSPSAPTVIDGENAVWLALFLAVSAIGCYAMAVFRWRKLSLWRRIDPSDRV